MGQNVGGADGCFLINPFILGGRRGLAIEGYRPARGYDWYGPAYYDEWGAMKEQKDKDGVVIQEARLAGKRYEVIYDELTMFILSTLIEAEV